MCRQGKNCTVLRIWKYDERDYLTPWHKITPDVKISQSTLLSTVQLFMFTSLSILVWCLTSQFGFLLVLIIKASFLLTYVKLKRVQMA